MAKRISVLEGARETMRWAGAGRVMVRCRPSVRVSGKVGAGAVVAVAWEALTTGAGRVACAAWVLQANRDRARISKEESAKRFIFDLLIRLNKNPCAQGFLFNRIRRSNMNRFALSSLLILALSLFACSTQAAQATLPAPVVNASQATATTAPAPTFPLTLTDGLQRTITLPAPAQRIVSLAPSNTEILFAIGAGPQLVGRDPLSDYPAEAQKVPDIGDT